MEICIEGLNFLILEKTCSLFKTIMKKIFHQDICTPFKIFCNVMFLHAVGLKCETITIEFGLNLFRYSL